MKKFGSDTLEEIIDMANLGELAAIGISDSADHDAGASVSWLFSCIKKKLEEFMGDKEQN